MREGEGQGMIAERKDIHICSSIIFCASGLHSNVTLGFDLFSMLVSEYAKLFLFRCMLNNVDLAFFYFF